MPDNETPIRTTKRSSDLQIYDNFEKPDYSLADYAEKWITPYGLGEMAVNDTRTFSGGYLNLSAVPFQTAHDVSVNDHLKYEAVSARTFPVPENGTLVLSSDIKASTPGTVPGLIQNGVYGPSGSWLDPASPPAPPGYSAPLLQGQQAAVVMNVLDFCTGQVFDWFVASDTAFVLIERLPSTVTGNVTNPDCRDAAEVGIGKMYTQIIREIPVNPDVWHHVDIALTRHDGVAWADYFLDHRGRRRRATGRRVPHHGRVLAVDLLHQRPLAAAVVGLGGRHVPESRDATATGKIDYAGAAAAVVFLTGITFAFIEAPTLGWSSPAVLTTTLIAAIGLAAFLTRERRAAAPMLPLSLFAERQFAATNAVTFIVYAALIGATFLLPVVLQIVSGYSPLASGLAFVPLTVIMLALSARSGQRSDLRDHPLRQQRARPVRAAPVPAGLTNLPVWGRSRPCAADPGPLPVA